MIEPAPTVGVEEEFVLVDAETGRAALVADALLAEPDIAADGELMRYQIEAATGVCRTLADVRTQLTTARRRLAGAAARHGALLLASGTLPLDLPALTALRSDERYAAMAARWPELVRRSGTAGAHVHVGVADRDLAVRALRRIRPWLPTLLALTANSPYAEGVDTGWDSGRFRTWSRWPTAVVPPVAESAAELDAVGDAAVAAGRALDRKAVYFLARLSPTYPTIEVRVADVCLTVDDAVLLTGITRALVATAVDDALRDTDLVDPSDEVLARACAAAAHHGLSGAALDPWTARIVAPQVMVDRLVAHVAASLDRTGDADEVTALLEAVRVDGNGADRQRRWAQTASHPAELPLRVAAATQGMPAGRRPAAA